jgi:hypothetical protein
MRGTGSYKTKKTASGPAERPALRCTKRKEIHEEDTDVDVEEDTDVDTKPEAFIDEGDDDMVGPMPDDEPGQDPNGDIEMDPVVVPLLPVIPIPAVAPNLVIPIPPFVPNVVRPAGIASGARASRIS